MAKPDLNSTSRSFSDELLCREIARLAGLASVEINVGDEKCLSESQSLLAPDTRIYVSHLPRQRWEDTASTCEKVRRSGFEPVPHVPVRLLESQESLSEVLGAFRKASGATEVLLISGDYPEPRGPYHAVSQVLATGLLERHGYRRVSLAGHPEGHPRVALDQIRESEREKVLLAHQHGLESRLVTQFLFEPTPFLEWVNEHRRQGVETRYVCGLAGPAKISTLVRYATRCGVGPSIRALGAHYSTLTSLLGDHGPDRMLRNLTAARLAGTTQFEGVHLFGFGGFIRTAQWLSRVAEREFTFDDAEGFST